MKKNLSDSVLKKIQEEDIRPVSRWYFVFRQIAFGVGALLFVIFGIMASAIIFHFLNNFEFAEFVFRGPRFFMKALWFGIPFLWIFCLGLSLVLGIAFVRHTRRGYRRGIFFWLFLFLLPQMVGGYFLESSALGERLDQGFARRISMYESRGQRQDRLWGNPEAGFLAGEIVEVRSDSLFVLEDRENKVWEVDYSASKVAKRVEIIPKERVRIFGNMKESGHFEADRIIPFHPHKKPGRGRGEWGGRPFDIKESL